MVILGAGSFFVYRNFSINKAVKKGVELMSEKEKLSETQKQQIEDLRSVINSELARIEAEKANVLVTR